jgi:hypothetical protein
MDIPHGHTLSVRLLSKIKIKRKRKNAHQNKGRPSTV